MQTEELMLEIKTEVKNEIVEAVPTTIYHSNRIDSKDWFIRYDKFHFRHKLYDLLIRSKDDEDLFIRYKMRKKQNDIKNFECDCKKKCCSYVEDNRRIVEMDNESHTCEFESFKESYIEIKKWTLVWGSTEDIEKVEQLKQYQTDLSDYQIIPEGYWEYIICTSGKGVKGARMIIKRLEDPNLCYQYYAPFKRYFGCTACHTCAFYVAKVHEKTRVVASYNNHKCQPKFIDDVIKKIKKWNGNNDFLNTNAKSHNNVELNSNEIIWDSPSVKKPKLSYVIKSSNTNNYIVGSNTINHGNVNNTSTGAPVVVGYMIQTWKLSPMSIQVFSRPSDIWQMNCCKTFNIQSTEDMYPIWSKLQKIDFSSNILPTMINKNEFENVYSLISYYLTGKAEYMMTIKNKVCRYIFINRNTFFGNDNTTEECSSKDEVIADILFTENITDIHFNVLSKLLECVIVVYNYDRNNRIEYVNGKDPTIVIGIQHQKYFLFLN